MPWLLSDESGYILCGARAGERLSCSVDVAHNMHFALAHSLAALARRRPQIRGPRRLQAVKPIVRGALGDTSNDVVTIVLSRSWSSLLVINQRKPARRFPHSPSILSFSPLTAGHRP